MFDSGASVLGGVQKSVVDNSLGVFTIHLAGGAVLLVARAPSVGGEIDVRDDERKPSIIS